MISKKSKILKLMPSIKSFIATKKHQSGLEKLMQPQTENSKREILRQKWSEKLLSDLFIKGQKEPTPLTSNDVGNGKISN